jgi:uncharacterized protein YjbI with pentapeptide repeats
VGAWVAARRASALEWVALAACVLSAGLGFIALGVRLRLRGANDARRLVAGELAADAGLALVTGAVVGLVSFAATQDLEQGLLDVQEGLEEDRFERDARRDNVRFVREVTTQADVRDKPFAELDLRGAELGGLDLSQADFRGADLANASLRRADLTDADLIGADLTGADLSYADLTGADLTDASLKRANLYYTTLASPGLLLVADLTRADLTEASLSSANIIDATLRGADLSRADLRNAGVVRADLSNTDLRGATFHGAYVANTDIRGADLTDAVLALQELDRPIYDASTEWPAGFDPPPSAAAEAP